MTTSRARAWRLCVVPLLVLGLGGCASAVAGGKPLHAPANLDLSLPGFVACSRLIVEGDVVRVTDAEDGHMTTTLKVARWVKPAAGGPTTTITTGDIAAEGVSKRWPPGTHLFLVASVDRDAIPQSEFTRSQFDAIARAVPAAATLSCPYGPT